MAQSSGSDNIIRPGRFTGPPGGSGPSDPTVDARLDRLEAAVDEIRKDLQSIRVDLARIDGKLSNIPTTFQLVFMLAAFMVANFLGATALSFAILKLGPH